jgi:hypothetical protein
MASAIETETGRCSSPRLLAFFQKTGTACHVPFRHGIKERIGTMFTCSFPWAQMHVLFLARCKRGPFLAHLGTLHNCEPIKETNWRTHCRCVISALFPLAILEIYNLAPGSLASPDHCDIYPQTWQSRHTLGIGNGLSLAVRHGAF